MTDLSATRQISAIATAGSGYFVGSGYNGYDRITVTEKNGDGAYIIWYQLWKSGEVVKEINSRLVESVDYEPTPNGEIPF